MSREVKVAVGGAALVSAALVVAYALRHWFAEAWAAGDLDAANRAAPASFLIRDLTIVALAVTAILVLIFLSTRSVEDTRPGLGADPWLGYL